MSKFKVGDIVRWATCGIGSWQNAEITAVSEWPYPPYKMGYDVIDPRWGNGWLAEDQIELVEATTPPLPDPAISDDELLRELLA